MDNFLTGKIAIVTGATRGIGYSIAEALARSGADLAICGRSPQAVESAVKNLRNESKSKVIGAAADVANPDDVSKFFALVDRELGGLDVLVNNAGIGNFAPTAALTLEQWKQTIDTNLNGVFYCSHEALPRFERRGAGYVINISSLAGKNPFAGGAAYNASKFAVNGFSEAMMLDHRQQNVRVSYIMPGSVDTAFGLVPAGNADWKIAPADIADVVLMMLKLPARTLVSRVEIRPAKPRP